MLFKPVPENGVSKINGEKEEGKKRVQLLPREPGQQPKNYQQRQADHHKKVVFFEILEFYFNIFVNEDRKTRDSQKEQPFLSWKI